MSDESIPHVLGSQSQSQSQPQPQPQGSAWSWQDDQTQPVAQPIMVAQTGPAAWGAGLRAWWLRTFWEGRSNLARMGFGCGGLIVVCLVCALCSGAVSALGGGASDTSAQATATTAVGQVATATSIGQAATATSIGPAVTATPSPKPTATPKPKPTATPKPTCGTDGAPPNPWCYTFANTGKLIYSPPGDFCSYFNCIASFWTNTSGYVDQCWDGTYSHSGGRTGACSRHGGERRPLYRP